MTFYNKDFVTTTSRVTPDGTYPSWYLPPGYRVEFNPNNQQDENLMSENQDHCFFASTERYMTWSQLPTSDQENDSLEILGTATLDYSTTEDVFVYMDPPYRLTNGSYNDGKRGFKGWDIKTEETLFNFADKLNNQGKRFMISYVLRHNGKVNKQLNDWIKRKGYSLINVKETPGIKRKEVLIVNYK